VPSPEKTQPGWLARLAIVRGTGRGKEPLRGPAVQTGHGLNWYVLPTGLGNGADVLPGVDFRGRDGYVVAPPSVHPDGHRYQWINPFLDDLAEGPEWLCHLLTPDRPEPVRNVSVDAARSTAYGRAALRRELDQLPY
jgi:Bifunctional DNA primase/polymerase, N-terminal